MKQATFDIYFWGKAAVEAAIKNCDHQGHFQQVIYSVAGKCITQICFACEKIHTSFKKGT